MIKRKRRINREAQAAADRERQEIRAIRDAHYRQLAGEAPCAVEPEPMPDPVAAAPSGDVEIPGTWRSLHWKQRVQLAKACYPGFEFVNAADADTAIERYLGSEQ
jgi:hypothetical protein